MKTRIYRYDNVKALLIFLVVIGHMTTDYVSDSHMVRWITLWIYTFHMPAFIFISGLVHKRYITEDMAAAGVRGETRLRWDKVWGFFFCAYGLKIFLQVTRTLMGQHPIWHTFAEPGIPWYLFVMAEYEILFYLLRRIDGGGADCLRGAGSSEDSDSADDPAVRVSKFSRAKPWLLVAGAFGLSAVIGYFPSVGDTFCLSRMINFLPIYMIGYYLDMKKVANFLNTGIWRRILVMKVMSWGIIIASLIICYTGKWSMYSWRKWFTGRRSYEFLADYFSYAMKWGWLIRPAVWAVALAITFAIITVIPDRDLKYGTVIGSRTLQVYFWHRPICYLFRSAKLLPRLCVLFGGTYNEAVAGEIRGLAFGGSTWSMLGAMIVYVLIGAGMTAFFSLKIFAHPTQELMGLGKKVSQMFNGGKRQQ